MNDHASSEVSPFELYRLLRGREPDTHWKALLMVAASSPLMWELISPYIDLEHGLVDIEALEQLAPELSHGEALMVMLGLSLYRGLGCVDLVAMAETLDRRHWEAALEAIRTYRAGFAEN